MKLNTRIASEKISTDSTVFPFERRSESHISTKGVNGRRLTQRGRRRKKTGRVPVIGGILEARQAGNHTAKPTQMMHTIAASTRTQPLKR